MLLFKIYRPLLIILTLAALLAGCNLPFLSQKVESPTIGKLTIYTTLPGDMANAYLDKFKTEYPDIDVTLVRNSTGLLIKQLFAEQANPQADVVWGLAVTSLMPAEWHGLLKPYAPVGLERVSPLARDTNIPPDWVGIEWWMSAFCVNTVTLDKLGLPIPHSWADLQKPIYANRIVTIDPSISNAGFLSIAGFFQIHGEEKVWNFLDTLHKNIDKYTATGGKPCELVAAGQYPIGIASDFVPLRPYTANSTMQLIYPTEGSGWDIEASTLIQKDHIKPVAKTFLDWAISDSAMQEYAQNIPLPSVPSGQPIPAGFPTNPMAQLSKVDEDIFWTAANRCRILALWLKRYSGSKREAKGEWTCLYSG